MNKVKEIEQEIIKVLEHPVMNYRVKAIKELAENKTALPNAMEIVANYPDFNSIRFRITQPKHFVVDMYINVEDLKNNPKAIHDAAKMVAKLRRM